MKKYCCFFLGVVIAILCLISCIDKQVPCKARLILAINNNLKTNITAKIIDSSEVWYDSRDVQIQIENDSVIVLPKQINIIPIEYKWTSLNYCEFTNGSMNIAYRVNVRIFSGDSMLLEKLVFPYDTTKRIETICTDCWHEYYDTIMIK